ncbi:MAG: sigma factor-like helix-turn-helix DNA-binding protein [Tepidisphaeraceae bacterium]
MPIDAQTLDLARRGDLTAIVAVLCGVMPGAFRITAGLTGNLVLTTRIVRVLVRQGSRVIGSWSDLDEPVRWSRHHAILLTRRVAHVKPNAESDTLFEPADSSVIDRAFVRAVRELPRQQQEAFILCHGEKLDLRETAVAMDCSTQAAEQHLREATRALKVIAQDGFLRGAASLGTAYSRLTPQDAALRATIVRGVRRAIIPRRIARTVVIMLEILILLLFAVIAWKLYPRLVY